MTIFSNNKRLLFFTLRCNKSATTSTFQTHRHFGWLSGILVGLNIFFNILLSPALADDFLDMSLEELINLQVTSAAKTPTPILKTPGAIHVITKEAIRRSGAGSIPELLKMVPGMNVAQLDSNRWAISARGFNGEFANKLLVMIDGRSVYTSVFSGVYWDIQDLILAEIERIEVIRGPGASLWGANAVNGIINIITRSADQTLGSQVTTWVDTKGSGGLSVMQGSEMGSNSYLRLTAKGFTRGENQLNGRDTDDDMAMGKAGFRWDYIGSDFTGKTTGGFYQGREGANFDQVNYQGDYHDLFNDDIDVKGGHLLSSWSNRLSEKSSLSFQVYFDYTQREGPFYDENLQVLDTEFQHNFEPSPGHKLTWGGNFRAYFDDLTAHSNVFMDPEDDQYTLFSLFVQDDYPLLKDLTLTLGTKVEHNDFTGWEFQPNGRLLWELSQTTSLWGAVSRAVRTPSRLESNGEILVALYPPGDELNPTPNAAIPVAIPIIVKFRGNDEFKSEELTAYELGLRSLISDRTSMDIALFWNTYKKLRTGSNLYPDIIFEGVLPVAIDQVSLANNKLKGDTYGLEVSMEYQMTDDWKLIGAYSYMEMDFDFGGRLEAFLNSFYTRHQASLQSRFTLFHTVETDLWVTYTDGVEVQNQPEIWDLTLRLGWQPSPKWQLELVGHNLLHDHKKQLNSEVLSMVSSEIERGAFLRLTCQF